MCRFLNPLTKVNIIPVATTNIDTIHAYLAFLLKLRSLCFEVLPKNNGNFIMNDKFYGYVEIINESENTVNLIFAGKAI